MINFFYSRRHNETYWWLTFCSIGKHL
jgi:hypothetical protein